MSQRGCVSIGGGGGTGDGEMMRVIKMPCPQCKIAITVSRKDKRVDKGSMYKHMLNSCPGINRDYIQMLNFLKGTKNKNVLYASDIKAADMKQVRDAGYIKEYHGLVRLLDAANDMIEEKVKINQGMAVLRNIASSQNQQAPLPRRPLGKFPPGKHKQIEPEGQAEATVLGPRLASRVQTGPSYLSSRTPRLQIVRENPIQPYTGQRWSRPIDSHWSGYIIPSNQNPKVPRNDNQNLRQQSLPLRDGVREREWARNRGGLKRRAPVPADGETTTKRIGRIRGYQVRLKEPSDGKGMLWSAGEWDILYPEEPERAIPIERFYDIAIPVCIRMRVRGSARNRLFITWFRECSKNPFVRPHIPEEILRTDNFAEIHRGLCGENADPRLREWLTRQLQQGHSVPVALCIGTERYQSELRFDVDGHFATVPIGEVTDFVATVRQFFEKSRHKFIPHGCTAIECEFTIELSALGVRDTHGFTIVWSRESFRSSAALNWREPNEIQGKCFYRMRVASVDPDLGRILPGETKGSFRSPPAWTSTSRHNFVYSGDAPPPRAASKFPVSTTPEESMPERREALLALLRPEENKDKKSVRSASVAENSDEQEKQPSDKKIADRDKFRAVEKL